MGVVGGRLALQRGDQLVQFGHRQGRQTVLAIVLKDEP